MLAIFLDIETTGLDPKKHCTIDLALQIVDLSNNKIVDTYQSVIKPTDAEWKQHDPQSLKINGYTWEEVSKGKSADDVCKDLIELYDNHEIVRGKAVYICQNPAFDRVFMSQIVNIEIQEELLWPYHWLDLASMHWALLLEKCRLENTPFPENITLSKNKIAERYGLPPEKSPHRAMNGVTHLMLCYEAVLGTKFKELFV
ncbi:MAG: 3'-5' exonuclease [Chlamydiota bacterium]|nr:3'-5' exonuclease [Chlamydiota bacterium]